MSEELREKAERLTQWAETAGGCGSPYRHGSGHDLTKDVLDVCAACLAELPADDAEPADGLWFLRLGAWRPQQSAAENTLVIGTAAPGGNTAVYPLAITYPARHVGRAQVWQVQVYGVQWSLAAAPTRGWVRRLLAALGVKADGGRHGGG